VSESRQTLRQRLEDEARALGFSAVGVARADAAPKTAERLKEWLACGAHGDMIWMEETAERRGSPASLWPDVQSVISLGMSYAPAIDPMALAGEKDIGRISVYAQGADYHDVIKRALKALARWLVAEAACELKVFVDTAPVMEKPLAEAAGLGWQGKHTNLVSRRDGSWLFLGAIYTTLDLEPAEAPHRVHCGSCNACLAACPTDAFQRPTGSTRGAAFPTSRSSIRGRSRTSSGRRWATASMAATIACRPARGTASPTPAGATGPSCRGPELTAPALSDLLALDDASFRAVFAGSPIKRIGRNRMVRNAAIAAGNSGRAELVPRLRELTSDADPVVGEAAQWALGKLTDLSAQA
jgi:epoxyqueuosine reductase